MSAALFVLDLADRGVLLRFDGRDVKASAPPGVLDAELLAALRARKQEIADYLGSMQSAGLPVTREGVAAYAVRHGAVRIWRGGHIIYGPPIDETSAREAA